MELPIKIFLLYLYKYLRSYEFIEIIRLFISKELSKNFKKVNELQEWVLQFEKLYFMQFF